MRLLKRFLVALVLLAGLAFVALAGLVYLVAEDDHDGPHDGVDDVISGANGPVTAIELWVDPRRQTSEITRIERLPAEKISRADVERCLQESATSDGWYGLSFREADGHEHAGHLISPLSKAGTDRLHFACQTSVPDGTHEVVLQRNDDGTWHDMTSRQVP